jgi:hypothetical protein
MEDVSLAGDVLRVQRRSFPLTDAEGINWFVQRETEFWNWLLEIRSYQLQNELAKYIQNVHFLRQAPVLEGEPATVSHYWAERLVELYNPGGLLLSTSPRAQFVKNIAADDVELAGFVLSELLGIGPSRLDSRQAVEALVITELYKRGIRKNVDSERAALQRVRDEWQDAMGEATAEHQRLRNNFELELRKAADQLSAVEDRAAASVKAFQGELAQQQRQRSSQEESFEAEVAHYRDQGKESVEAIHGEVETAKAELNRLTSAYNEHMALKSPVAYWQENGDTHHASAKTYLKVLALVVPISVLLLAGIGWFLLGSEERPPVGHIILFFMFAGLIVWLLRVLSRLYLSHKHLEVDARERIVAAKTYLALIGEGVEAREAERTIIMGTLFRPASIGILHDDAVPASSIELVGRLMKGDK